MELDSNRIRKKSICSEPERPVTNFGVADNSPSIPPRLLRNVARLMDEELYLTANLSDYDAYCDKVRHRFDCERLVGPFGPMFFCGARPCQ